MTENETANEFVRLYKDKTVEQRKWALCSLRLQGDKVTALALKKLQDSGVSTLEIVKVLCDN